MSSYNEFRMQTKRRRRKRTLRRVAAFFIMAVVICALAWVITWIIESFTGEKDPGSSSSSASQPASGSDSAPSSEPQSGAEAKPAGWNVVGPLPQTVDAAITSPDYRMISLPENGRVDNSYFSSALFIGDSISQGFRVYNNSIKDVSTFCAYRGVGPDGILNNVTAVDADGVRGPVQDALKNALDARQPEHIYILLGSNSMKTMADENFLTYYAKLLDWLEGVARPDAQIYIQAIPPVKQSYEQEFSQYSQTRIYQLNNALAQMAYERGLYFVDLNGALADDSGYLREDYGAADGMHLKTEGYEAWISYLATHTAYSPTNPYLLGSPYYQAPNASSDSSQAAQ